MSSGYAVSRATSSRNSWSYSASVSSGASSAWYRTLARSTAAASSGVARGGGVDVERGRGLDERRVDGRELDGHRPESSESPVAPPATWRRADVVRRRRAEQGQRDLELLAQDRQRPLDAGLAARGQRPEDRPADQHARARPAPGRSRGRGRAGRRRRPRPRCGRRPPPRPPRSTSIGAATRSSWRAPWLLTTIASTPCSTASARPPRS